MSAVGDARKRQQERAQAGAVDGPSERPWPEGVWPTVKQWLPWFFAQAPDEQDLIAEYFIRDAQEARECFMQKHKARLALVGVEITEAQREAWREGHAAGRDYQGDGWNSDAHDPEEDNPYRQDRA